MEAVEWPEGKEDWPSSKVPNHPGCDWVKHSLVLTLMLPQKLVKKFGRQYPQYFFVKSMNRKAVVNAQKKLCSHALTLPRSAHHNTEFCHAVGD